jgi:Flp pilus assembly pilin Flp
MLRLLTYLQGRLSREEGQTMAEYGVVLAVICAATVAIFGTLHTTIVNAVQAVITAMGV